MGFYTVETPTPGSIRESIPILPHPTQAPPPPYSVFDAFIDQTPAERTWEERHAAYIVLDHYDGESRGELRSIVIVTLLLFLHLIRLPRSGKTGVAWGGRISDLV